MIPAEIDALLASALRRAMDWPPDWNSEAAQDRVLDRIAYHGVAGLLNEEAGALERWPASVRDRIRRATIARSMWELRHRIVLRELLERLSAGGVSALLLKGTAIAYDLYENPASRERSDSDLLVDKADREGVRQILEICGFTRQLDGQDLPDALRAQESWDLTANDGTSHSIDLHWQPLNAPALDRRLGFAEMVAGARPLPRLSEAALVPSRPMMLLHACLHRGLHDCAPYFVGSETYFGGNRLIWLHDLAILGRALSEAEWRGFCRMVIDKRVADVCVAGLATAESRFGSFCPPFVHDELGRAKSGRYFRSGQFGRALQDMSAIHGMRGKWQYLWARSLPTPEFMRAKYPDMGGKPLARLYLRRFIELVRARPRNDMSGAL